MSLNYKVTFSSLLFLGFIIISWPKIIIYYVVVDSLQIRMIFYEHIFHLPFELLDEMLLNFQYFKCVSSGNTQMRII
jgi:hypothetical protein